MFFLLLSEPISKQIRYLSLCSHWAVRHMHPSLLSLQMHSVCLFFDIDVYNTSISCYCLFVSPAIVCLSVQLLSVCLCSCCLFVCATVVCLSVQLLSVCQSSCCLSTSKTAVCLFSCCLPVCVSSCCLRVCPAACCMSVQLFSALVSSQVTFYHFIESS